jgi:PAS domain-containing protein
MILNRLTKGERVAHLETVRRRKNGSLVEVSLTVSPIRDDKGNVVGASKIMRDIAERNRAGTELKKSHERISIATQAAGPCRGTDGGARNGERDPLVGRAPGSRPG